MSSQDLTTLAALKSWLGVPASVTSDDAKLSALVTAASRAIYALIEPSWAAAAILRRDHRSRALARLSAPLAGAERQQRDARRHSASCPRRSSVGGPVNGYCLKPGDAAPPGAPQALDLFDQRIRRRRQNLVVNYRAGYAVESEAQTAPTLAPWTLSAAQPYGPWASDLGVVYAASGAPLSAVASSPAVGHYSVSSGLYTFSANDAGASLLISYGYAPQDIAQAALELAAERFRTADRIGLRSKSMGGQETISYDVSAISAPVLALVQPYRRVAV